MRKAEVIFARTLRRLGRLVISLITIIFVAGQPVWADEETQAWTIETALTVDVMSNRSGGLSQGTDVLENLDIQLTLDLEKLAGWNGATFFLYGLANHGDRPSETVGDFQTLDNIDAPQHFSFFELWLEKSFLSGELSFKLGLFDVNSEFDCTETAGLFLNSSFGIGPDFSQSGANGPSIFPVTSLALRAAVNLTDHFYWQTVLADGVPGDPNDDSRTHINLGGDDGVLFVTEVGMFAGDSLGRIALGGWYYSTESEENATGNSISPIHNQGLYLICEMSLSEEKGDPSQGLAAFGRFGIADSTINQVDSYLGGGLVYTGLFSARGQDQLGLAFAHARTSKSFRSITGAEKSETAIEISYVAAINDWLTLQPDLQYIINPGMHTSLDNAFVIGIRIIVSSVLE